MIFKFYSLLIPLVLVPTLCVHAEDSRRHPSRRFEPVSPVEPIDGEKKKGGKPGLFFGSDPKQPSGCDETSRPLGPPYIQITSVKRFRGNPIQKYRVSGTIEGVCLVDAGYFEGGVIRQRIPVETSPHFARSNFQVLARADRNPEIRAVNANGARQVIPIELPTNPKAVERENRLNSD